MSRGSSPCRLLALLALLEAVPLLATRACYSAREYSVVIDVGSTGSRVRVYTWTRDVCQVEVPGVSEVHTYKKKPGFGTLTSDPEEITPYVTDLVEDAARNVPEKYQRDTPIYFLATAGMRLLMEERANSMMALVDDLFSDSSVNPFRYSPHHTRILSGEEEGAFAWIALNYLRGYFTGTTSHHAGIMEMGGASTQVAFVPDVSPLANKFPVTVGGREYPLYVHSYLYYGQTYSFRWSVEWLVNNNPGMTRLDHPCMLRGDNKTEVINGVTITLEGSSDPSGCLNIINEFVYKVKPMRCHPKPCAIGPFYQPSIPDDMMFHAMSAFTYPIDAYDINTSTISPQQILQAANTYCSMTLTEALKSTGEENPDFLSANCQDGLYAYVLFTKAYGFPNDTDKIIFTGEIDGHNVNWPLGSVIYEISQLQVTCGSVAYAPVYWTITIAIICSYVNIRT